MRESDAKKKTCPIMTAPIQGSPTFEVTWVQCQGSECAVWVKTPTDPQAEPLGHCGFRQDGVYMRR